MSEPLRPGESYAGFWIRFLAFVVDSIVVSLVVSPLAALLVERPDNTRAIADLLASADPVDALWLLADLLRPASVLDGAINLGIPAVGVVLFWVYRSATPGKMATRTVIRDAETGAAPDKRQCIVRYLGYFVSMFGLGLGFLWVAFDKRKQGWHDKMARTVVVRLAPNA